MDLRAALECECCSTRVDILHDVVTYSDEAVAKALMTPEVARIAKLEMRMREFLLAKWNVRATAAAKAAGNRVAGGGTLKNAFAIIDKSMARWAKDATPRFSLDAGKCYNLARAAGVRKASGKTKASLSYQVPNFTQQLSKVEKASGARDPSLAASFALADARALEDLDGESALWIGRHYDANVRETLREAVKPATLQGMSSRAAGDAVRDAVESQLAKVTVPGGFNGSAAQYFEGLAANTVTNARVRGQIRSFQEYGITRYELVNPMDNRTSRVCVHLNGKVFLVQRAVEQMEAESGVFDPDEIRKIHPWSSYEDLIKISPTRGHVSDKDSAALADAGFALPPYHFRCRTTVDVSFS